jgi:acylphosphatase
MLKKTALFLLVLFVAAVAFAADPAVKGKITAIEDGKVTVALEGDKAAWVKKNAPVKFTEGIGKIVEVSGTDPVVIVFKTKKASELKVGDSISLQKGKAMAGC